MVEEGVSPPHVRASFHIPLVFKRINIDSLLSPVNGDSFIESFLRESKSVKPSFSRIKSFDNNKFVSILLDAGYIRLPAVFVMEEDEPKLTFVDVGIMDFSFAEIVSGLEQGDVVTTGLIETE